MSRRTNAGLQLFFTLSMLGLAGCGSGLKFKPLRLDAKPDEYRRTDGAAHSIVSVEKHATGLRCVVVSDTDPTVTHYGGIMLPGQGAKAFRLDMKFADPENIIIMYVDALNKQGRKVARWQTDQWAKLRREKTTYTFVPQQSTKGFNPIASDGTGGIEKIHVYVAVQRSSGVIFEVSGIQLGR